MFYLVVGNKMSKIGRKPIDIPQGVEIKIEGKNIKVIGPKGVLELKVSSCVDVKAEEGKLFVTRVDESKQSKAVHGLYRSLINNMIEGVTKGFEKKLLMKGTGYRAEVKGDNKLILHIGFSHPVEITSPPGVSLTVHKGTEITVSGIDKCLVGNIASKIRRVRPPEPYKGKGIRYVDEVIRKKTPKVTKVITSTEQ